MPKLIPTEKAKNKAKALRTLGLRQFATQTEIRAAWRSLAMKVHPDRADGSNAEFAHAKTAYDYLCDPNNGASLSTEKRPEPFFAKHTRPQIETRTTELSQDAEIACKIVLGQQDNGAQHEASAKEAALVKNRAEPAGDRITDSCDHVPNSIRRRGRQMSYLVNSPLEQGANRVALPTGDLVNRGQVPPKVMKFKSPKSGRGTIEVPSAMLAEFFPGAQSLRIHFLNAGQGAKASA